MKVHDKFVIELAEVIKGYGNDYRVKGAAKLPCDYKFYEISGVAICEESFKKMKPLNDEINNVLDKIRADVEQYQADCDLSCSDDANCRTCDRITFDSIYRIIDKYRKGDKE